jgi:hypothetical protein
MYCLNFNCDYSSTFFHFPFLKNALQSLWHFVNRRQIDYNFDRLHAKLKKMYGNEKETARRKFY